MYWHIKFQIIATDASSFSIFTAIVTSTTPTSLPISPSLFFIFYFFIFLFFIFLIFNFSSFNFLTFNFYILIFYYFLFIYFFKFFFLIFKFSGDNYWCSILQYFHSYSYFHHPYFSTHQSFFFWPVCRMDFCPLVFWHLHT